MFKKGDIVIAKDGFLNPGEKLEDTIGIVLSYSPSNDYMELGVIHPEKWAIPPISSVQGEFYRLLTNSEMKKYGLLDKPVEECVSRLLNGEDIRTVLGEYSK